MATPFNDSVLLVDDQKMFAGFLAATVAAIRPDSKIERASSFEEADLLLEDRVLRGEPFSSVVTDYMLDDVGGTSLALVKAAAEQGSRVAVISGDASKMVVDKCVAAGASAFIEKKMDEYQLKLCLELFFGGVNFVPTPPPPPQHSGRVTKDKDLTMLYYIATGLKLEQIAHLMDETLVNVKAQTTRVTALFAKTHGIPLPSGKGQRDAMEPEMRRFGYHELPEHLEGKVKT
jgi:DNA-binding NarL/FixJ family response regulator